MEEMEGSLFANIIGGFLCATVLCWKGLTTLIVVLFYILLAIIEILFVLVVVFFFIGVLVYMVLFFITGKGLLEYI